MRRHDPMPRRQERGFTLVELAVVVTVVVLLLLSLMYTFSAQVEQRDFEETRRRLEQARELVLAFAIVNGRLPCPARANSNGLEVRNAATGECKDGASVEDYYGGTPGGVDGGLLPAASIGFPTVDSSGFALDAWQNRIRYVVARNVTCSGAATFPHFENALNLKTNGMSCQPNDLLVCKSVTGVSGGTCGSTANQIMSQGLVTAIVFSTGKNFGTAPSAAAATAAGRIDEAANLNGDAVFVFHTPTPSSFANGEFDDQMIWITVGETYGKLIGAGVLP
jgi:prepilin-type N-terminal cleavage/methylation domain-containing protein